MICLQRAALLLVHLPVAIGFLALPACVSDRPANKPEPRPQPAAIAVGKVWISSTPPQDTDINGYFDSVDLTIYLFGENYPASLLIPGAFTFELVAKLTNDAKPAIPPAPLAAWTIPADAAAANTGSSAVGPFYSFRLSLLDRGGDKLPDQTADLVVTFTPSASPTAGRPIRETVAVRVGRLRS